MPLERQLKKLRNDNKNDMIWVEVPRSRLRRPFPLWWGLAALALFCGFAVVTQLQFSRIAAEDNYNTRVEAWETEVKGVELAQDAHDSCIDSIGSRKTLRETVDGISTVLELIANRPSELLPDSPVALEYTQSILIGIETLITIPTETGLPLRTAADCPPDPGPAPPKPKR